MGCNCGDNEYNITVDNNGNCEPTTPIYNITLGNVGVNGYSPIVRFVNETIDSFNIAVDNVTGTETSPAVPKLSYVSDQIDNINTTIANLGDTYLTKNGSNATLPFTISDFKILSDGSVRVTNEDITGYLNVKEIRPRNASGITIGYTISGSYPINLITNDKAYYNSKEIATVDQIPTKTSDLDNDSGFITSSDLPTVGNGTITITQNGVTKGTFTTNQSGNATISLDSGVTNPLTITDETSNNFLQFIVNDSGSYIRSGTQGLSFNGYLITTVDNPLSLEDVAFGLKAISLKYDNDTIKVNQNGQLYADVQGGGGSYTAGTGIDITNDVISVGNTVAMKTDIPTVNNPTITFTQGGVTKGSITLNQTSNQTIALDAGGSGGGAVDSVNGQTGVVVLDASDVGALPDTTVIPTKTSDLTNDSNFATVSQIPTNNNQLTNGAGYITISALNGYATQTWVGQQGYLTSSDLTNYVTNSTLTTALADYQPLLVSGTNIKTVNNTSLLGSGNINVLTNTASSNTSLTVGGTASSTAYSTNVGFGSQATASAAQAFGHYAIASGSYSLALGQGAEANNSYSIQIGKGTNSTAKSLMVGFGTNGNYQLLDGTTGLIPDARISSNIARTSQIPDVSNLADTSLSNLSTTGQAVIDGKVSKSGDTMTGALNLDMTTVGSTNENYQDIQFVLDDINRAGLRCSHLTDGTNRVQIIVRNNSGTLASGYTASNNNGTLSCSFPNTTCVDGEWKSADYAQIVKTATSVNGSSSLPYDIKNIIPKDGYDYLVDFAAEGRTGATSGDFFNIRISSDIGGARTIVRAQTRSNSTVYAGGFCSMPVSTSRQIYLDRSTSWKGEVQGLWICGYRRLGTNS